MRNEGDGGKAICPQGCDELLIDEWMFVGVGNIEWFFLVHGLRKNIILRIERVV